MKKILVLVNFDSPGLTMNVPCTKCQKLVKFCRWVNLDKCQQYNESNYITYAIFTVIQNRIDLLSQLINEGYNITRKIHSNIWDECYVQKCDLLSLAVQLKLSDMIQFLLNSNAEFKMIHHYPDVVQYSDPNIMNQIENYLLKSNQKTKAILLFLAKTKHPDTITIIESLIDRELFHPKNDSRKLSQTKRFYRRSLTSDMVEYDFSFLKSIIPYGFEPDIYEIHKYLLPRQLTEKNWDDLIDMGLFDSGGQEYIISYITYYPLKTLQLLISKGLRIERDSINTISFMNDDAKDFLIRNGLLNRNTINGNKIFNQMDLIPLLIKSGYCIPEPKLGHKIEPHLEELKQLGVSYSDLFDFFYRK